MIKKQLNPALLHRQSQRSLKPIILNQLLTNLRNTNSFGYKTITQQQIKIINQWYKNIHKVNIQIKLNFVKFFGDLSTVYTYLIMGLTQQQDNIVTSNHIPKYMQKFSKGMNRKLIKIEGWKLANIKNYAKQIQKIKKSKIIIISNPDLLTGQCWSQNCVKDIIQICKQNSIYVIVDESLGDLCPNFQTILTQSYQGLIIIKKLGAILEDDGIVKNLCIFNSLQIKQKCANSLSNALMILPGQLTIQLIHTTINNLAYKQQQNILINIQQNYTLLTDKLKKFLINKQNRYKQKCNSQFIILNLQQFVEDIHKKIEKYMQYIQIQQLKDDKNRISKYIRINLNMNSQILKEQLKNIQQDYTIKPKL